MANEKAKENSIEILKETLAVTANKMITDVVEFNKNNGGFLNTTDKHMAIINAAKEIYKELK